MLHFALSKPEGEVRAKKGSESLSGKYLTSVRKMLYCYPVGFAGLRQSYLHAGGSMGFGPTEFGLSNAH